MSTDQTQAAIAEARRLIEREQYRDAQRVLESVLAEEPEAVEAWHLFGTACYRAGDLDGAERAYRIRLALTPDDPVAHYSLAIALRDRGAKAEAIGLLHGALALKSDFGPARERLAELEAPQPAPAAANPPLAVKTPPAADMPIASDATEIIGVATGVRTRVVPDPWLGRGQLTILSFRVVRQDPTGRALPPVPIEIRGVEIDGDILEGDHVSVPGVWRPGRASRTRSVTNLRTLQVIRGNRRVRTLQLVILVIFLLAVVAFGVFVASNIAQS